MSGLRYSDIVDGRRVLHFAPEAPLGARIRAHAGTYITADLYRGDCDLKMDISKMSVADEQFDVVIAGDVLEHVPDDRGAMREMHRVIRPGGHAILTVPQPDGLQSTVEDTTVTDPAEQERLFGVPGHVRLYGDDFASILDHAGFAVATVGSSDLPRDVARRYVLSPEPPSQRPLATNNIRMYFCRRT